MKQHAAEDGAYTENSGEEGKTKQYKHKESRPPQDILTTFTP